MPKKLDLSDRYARGGQRRTRRRSITRPIEEDAIEYGTGAVTVSTVSEPVVEAVVPVRPVPRARPVTLQNYHYIRTDLIRIGLVTGILLVLMAVLFVILR